MRNILLLLIIIVIITNPVFGFDPPLKIEPQSPKIAAVFQDSIKIASPTRDFKIWVFFTDKEIFDKSAYKKALADLENRFTTRAMVRRQNRVENKAVDFFDIPVSGNYVRQLEQAGLKISHQSRWLNAVSGHANPEIVQKISEFQFVSEIRPVAVAMQKPQPKELYKIHDIGPQDTIYGSSFTQLDQIDVIKMQHLGYTGKGALIAFLDAGYILDHPAFDSMNILAKYDFINNDTTVNDTIFGDTIVPGQTFHGTLTLSTCGGYAPGELIGPAYKADYIVAETEETWHEVRSEEDNWVAAAEWADSLGADIISSSLGYFDWYTFSDLDGKTAVVTIAAELASSRGIAVFNAAGNERLDQSFPHINPPADGPSVIAVGAVNSEGIIADFSSPGPTYDGRIKPDLVAMGVGTRAAYYLGGYTYGNGTSLSTPLAAGAGALILEAHPDWSPAQLRQAMIGSADRYTHPDNLYGYGLFNTFKAAGIFRISQIDPIRRAVGDSLNLRVSVVGFEDSAVTFSAQNLPPTAVFTADGELRYKAVEEDIGSREIEFFAVFGSETASLKVQLSVFIQGRVAVGPNPFSDSLIIFLGLNAGNLQEISIHTAAGEKVWESSADNNNGHGGTVIWRGINFRGQRVAPGVYFIVVRTDGLTQKFKVFLM